MNWNQLYASASPAERLELVMLMLQTIEARQRKWVFARRGILRERRGGFPGAHFINDQRRRASSPRQKLYMALFASILLLVSTATWLFVVHAPAQLAAPVLLVHLASLTGILLVKPYKPKTQRALS